jgi:hypothetical protein
VQTQDVRYSEGEVEFLGYLAFDETARDKRPGVLVVHEDWDWASILWSGRAELQSLGM